MNINFDDLRGRLKDGEIIVFESEKSILTVFYDVLLGRHKEYVIEVNDETVYSYCSFTSCKRKLIQLSENSELIEI